MRETGPGRERAEEPDEQRVLVVEDEPVINQAVAERLAAEGFAVRQEYDGPAAVTAAAAWRPHLVVLDVMLPGFDGHEVCRRVQAERPVPVLMLTARDDETDVLVGLGVGADDYLTKPFSMRELVARVRALLRRVDRAAELAAAGQDDSGALVLGDLRMDRAGRRCRRPRRAVHLTPDGVRPPRVPGRRPGDRAHPRAAARPRCGTGPTPPAPAPSTATCRSLRGKIGAGLVRTVHGVGYALERP